MRIIFCITVTIISLLITSFSYSMLDEIKKDLHKAKEDIATVIGVVIPPVSEYIKGESKAITDNPYKDTDACVRQGAGISQGEKEYLKQRLSIVKAALERLTKQELCNDHIPTIAVACSGGGIRAMLCTTGTLAGLRKIGALDATTYVTGLSGSTWAIAPWISTGMPLKYFESHVIECAKKPFLKPTDAEELLIFEAAAIYGHFGQPRTPVNPYAAFLGTKILEHFQDIRHEVYLSQQVDTIQSGKLPYPVYVAVDADEEIVDNQKWYDFTPHEIGNSIDQIYIPTWAYGRTFKKGESHKNNHTLYPPEKNLSYHTGTWGSAFGANMHTIEHEIAKKIGQHEFIEKVLKPLEAERPINCYAKVANYTYKLTSQDKAKYKTFVDAGTDFNLPIPPISGLNGERKADIIIICDASAGTIGNELKKAAHYMQQHNLPFPKIDLTDIDKTTMRIFKEEDPRVPIVIYLPRISDQKLWEAHKDNPKYSHYNLSGFDLDYETNSGFAQTIHFDYEERHAQAVINQMKFNALVHKKAIIDVIKYAINKKKLSTK